MPLSVHVRSDGDITILTCAGRLIEGAEENQLDRQFRELMQMLNRHFVLNLQEVSFVDSAGLGLLVRLLSRVRAAGGTLKLCAVPSNVQKALHVTRLHTVLVPYASESDAVDAIYAAERESETGPSAVVDVLCIHPSSDVLAYMQQVLRGAGYGVITTTNLSDAVKLRRATTPSVIVIDTTSSPDWRAGATRLINDRPERVQVVELPATFATDDPEIAGQRLLAAVARAAAANA